MSPKPKAVVRLTRQELDDILSALNFFIREYEKVSRLKIPDTKKAMSLLNRKLWRVLLKEFK